MKIDINVDMGESFGMYQMGNDEACMPYISSANVACGFHAGDPSVMKKTVAIAKKYGVHVGAHPGLPDLRGFGRREMKMTMEEIHDDLIYQIGALKAFVEADGEKLHHVKPHGSLYGMMARQKEVAQAVCHAIKAIDQDLFLYTMEKGVAGKVAAEMGINVIYEIYGDLDYDGEGNLVITRSHGAPKPEAVAAKVLKMVKSKKVVTTEGTQIDIDGSSICLHSDTPGALDIIKTVYSTLKDEGYVVSSPKI